MENHEPTAVYVATCKGLAPVVVLPGLFLKGVAEVCVHHVCKALHKDRVQIHIGIIRLKFQNCED